MHVRDIAKWFWTRDIISLWVLWCHACWSPRWLVRNLKSKLLRFASNMWTWHTMHMFTLSTHLHVSKPLLPWSILACPPQHWMSSQSPHSTHSTGNWMISVQSNLWMSVTFLKWKDLIQKTRTCLFKKFLLLLLDHPVDREWRTNSQRKATITFHLCETTSPNLVYVYDIYYIGTRRLCLVYSITYLQLHLTLA